MIGSRGTRLSAAIDGRQRKSEQTNKNCHAHGPLAGSFAIYIYQAGARRLYWKRNFPYEAVTAFGKSFDKLRLLRGVAEGSANLVDGRAEAVIEIVRITVPPVE